jgi:thiol-disulfide isomerase/thioredoxin
MQEITSDEQFNKLIHQKGKITVIKFTATWCGPCKSTFWMTHAHIKVIEGPMKDLAKKYSNASFGVRVQFVD